MFFTELCEFFTLSVFLFLFSVLISTYTRAVLCYELSQDNYPSVRLSTKIRYCVRTA